MDITQLRNQLRQTGAPTLVMGILNVTPDSFSDGGLFVDPDAAVEQALKMERDGADLIDIGGESTRPGSEPVPFDVERERVLPVIKKIRARSSITISVDTYKAELAREALLNGADLINDISGFMFDLDLVDVVRDFNAPVIIMHIKGTPRNMQKDPRYTNLLAELTEFFRERIKFARESGLDDSQIILDPGIGFGKRVEDNFEIIRKLKQIVDLGYPVMIGPSRKSFIGQTLNLPPDQRLEGTAAAVTAGILNGARIVRVHDVQFMKRTTLIADAIRGVTA
ncbi:MAG: dihydropteroate synthase [Candidatus Neomarinimicrobiota bacterium]